MGKIISLFELVIFWIYNERAFIKLLINNFQYMKIKKKEKH